MLEITLEKALDGDIDTADHYLYLCRDGAVVFYIGRSTAPLERLREHLGQGDFGNVPSALGRLIHNHLPLSLTWIMQFLTIADCETLVCHYRPEYSEWYIQQMNRGLAREASEIAEEALIDHYRPCLNIVGNRFASSLPEQYRSASNLEKAEREAKQKV